MSSKKIKLSSKNRRMLEQAKQEAHKRVVKHGVVQFRADEQLMELLLKAADYKRMPLGTLVRSWVVDRLRSEAVSLPLNVVKLPSGKKLTIGSSSRELENAALASQSGRLNLSAIECSTICDWLLSRHSAKFD